MVVLGPGLEREPVLALEPEPVPVPVPVPVQVPAQVLGPEPVLALDSR